MQVSIKINADSEAALREVFRSLTELRAIPQKLTSVFPGSYMEFQLSDSSPEFDKRQLDILTKFYRQAKEFDIVSGEDVINEIRGRSLDCI